MKRITLFLLLLTAVLMNAQTNPIQIINFSTQDIKFTLLSNNPNTAAQDCLSRVFSEDPVLLPSGSSVTYTQHNTSHLATPPINKWRVYDIAGPDVTYDLTTGAQVPTATTNISVWGLIRIFTQAGEEFDLGRSCTDPVGNYALPSGGSINATWSTLNGNVLIVIT